MHFEFFYHCNRHFKRTIWLKINCEHAKSNNIKLFLKIIRINNKNSVQILEFEYQIRANNVLVYVNFIIFLQTFLNLEINTRKRQIYEFHSMDSRFSTNIILSEIGFY